MLKKWFKRLKVWYHLHQKFTEKKKKFRSSRNAMFKRWIAEDLHQISKARMELSLKRKLKKDSGKYSVDPKKMVIMTNTFRYTCNPKYIYEEIKRQNLDLDVTWLTDTDNPPDYPEDVKTVRFNSAEGIQAVLSAKYWLNNGICFSNYFDKKPEQISIQTMHGSLGIKRLDNAVICRNDRGKEGQKVVSRESNDTSFVITNSQFEEDVFASVFWKNTPMVRLGHARTDVLFTNDPEKLNKIRQDLYDRYKIPVDKKIALFGPTHRKGFTIKDLPLDYFELTEAFSKRFGGEFVFLMRLHNRTKNITITGNDGISDITDIVYDVSDYPDIQELMMVTDVAISDYSSWIFDYVLTRRPGFIFAADLTRYNNNTGLCYPLEESPFPVCRSQREFIDKILNFDMENFQQRVEEFLEDKESVDEGHSAENIVNWLKELAD